MNIFGAIGNGASKLGGGLLSGAQKIGQVTKTGMQKVGEVAKTGKQKLEDILNSQGEGQDTTTPQEKPQETQTGKKRLANALAELKNLDFSNQNNYHFTPSMVDYSQYASISPETQRYLYGG